MEVEAKDMEAVDEIAASISLVETIRCEYCLVCKNCTVYFSVIYKHMHPVCFCSLALNGADVEVRYSIYTFQCTVNVCRLHSPQ